MGTARDAAAAAERGAALRRRGWQRQRRRRRERRRRRAGRRRRLQARRGGGRGLAVVRRLCVRVHGAQRPRADTGGRAARVSAAASLRASGRAAERGAHPPGRGRPLPSAARVLAVCRPAGRRGRLAGAARLGPALRRRRLRGRAGAGARFARARDRHGQAREGRGRCAGGLRALGPSGARLARLARRLELASVWARASLSRRAAGRPLFTPKRRRPALPVTPAAPHAAAPPGTTPAAGPASR
jgi:hypothetical protein